MNKTMETPCKTEDDCPTPMWCRGKDRCPKRDVKEQALVPLDAAACSPLEISDVRWEYEDELPEMEDADFDAIFPASRVLGMECGGVRMYPYVEDSSGNRIWITHLPSGQNCNHSNPEP